MTDNFKECNRSQDSQRASYLIPSMPGQHRVQDPAPSCSRSSLSPAYQIMQCEGEVMDEASGLQQSSADLFQNVSECLSTRSLLQIQTEEFRAVKSAEATEKLGRSRLNTKRKL
ncbi:hypothetical protein NQZ68_007583 [Dissostichus eleginoides]|nr:hypothetical protein NQZ68_007583 [Dissostichus eleginoides]